MVLQAFSKLVHAEWDRHGKAMGVVLPRLTANAQRKLFVSTSREGGVSRGDQELIAFHMAHRVTTADDKYDKSSRSEARERIIGDVVGMYKVRHNMTLTLTCLTNTSTFHHI